MSIIMKFGGTSVANAEAINQVAGIVAAARAQQPVVVTSALAHVTNLLLEIADCIAAGKRASIAKILKEIEARHMSVLKSFNKNAREKIAPKIEAEFVELRAIVSKIKTADGASTKYRDLLSSFGERLSSWLVAGALLHRGISAERIDSRELVCTDSNFGGAEVDFKKTQKNFTKIIRPLLKKELVPVITGFIGKSPAGETTTLGRGGSDYSAAIVAVSLSASEIQIWKDIPGFMTADPRVCKTARVIPQLSFNEAAELSYFGAKLLHPKTIHPAVKKNIPVRILNTFNPRDRGTLIYGSADDDICNNAHLPVRAIAYKKGITVINVCSLRMLGPYGFLERLFQLFSQNRVPVDVVATSEVSVSMTIEDGALTPGLISDLEKIGTVYVHKAHAILSVVGCGLKKDPRVEAIIFETLAREHIPTEMVSKGASAINITFIIEEKYCEKAVKALHESFFTN